VNTALPIPNEDVQTTAEQMRKTLTYLVQMASSDCADVKIIGLQALCQLTTDRRSHSAVLEECGIERLLLWMQSKNEDVHRCALTALANVTATCSNRVDVWKKVVTSGLKPLCLLVHSETAHVVREAARFIVNLAAAMGSGLLPYDDVKTAVSHLRSSADMATRSLGNRAQLHLSSKPTAT